MMINRQHATCTNCKAVDRLEWVCKLGYKVVAGKRFKPRDPCPKPITKEQFDELQSNTKRG